MKLHHVAALALVGWYLLVPRWCVAEPYVFDRCNQQVNVRQILEFAMSTAHGYRYKTDEIFMELEGPMHWQTLASSKSEAVTLHPQIKQWKDELAKRCLWSIYFGCEPAHETSDGRFFEGCLDYPPELWLD
jgi:hypothetical protein